MKSFFLYLIIVISIVSCKKEDDSDPRWGTASALLNGEVWTGEISSVDNVFESDTGIIISISSVNQAGIDEDYLGFFKVPTIVDKFPIFRTNVEVKDSLIGAYYNTLLSDGHVIGDVYYILEDDSVEDYIEITELTGIEIKGNFQASFLRDTGPLVGPSTPDTIVFKNGQFHTRIRY